MKLRLYVPIYSLTLLLSATLLFSVQPLFSKMILPLLGGTPQVWNTAMLFFQLMLLAGYAYAHGTSKFLGVRAQAILHVVLLCIFTVVLPITIPEGWVPPADEDPTIWQLSLMAATVGGPFFVLSGSAPMLQRWFSGTDHPDASNPYFLYGASNLGSMTALLAYPVIIEPLMDLTLQSNTWSIGYFALIACTFISAVLIWGSHTKETKSKTAPANDQAISWSLRIRWLVLAFIPSSLMLGVTTFITTDIASVPLLWILPLALYVGTFIIVFARKRLIEKKHIMFAHGGLMIVLIAQMIAFEFTPFLLIGFHMLLFFVSALACHTELADSRPSATHLTEFYLIMSIGGALGGVFNAIIAPNFFIIPLEYAFALVAACFMRHAGTKIELPKPSFEFYAAIAGVVFVALAFNVMNKSLLSLLAFGSAACFALIMDKRFLFAAVMAISLLYFPPGHSWGKNIFAKILHQDRNFFGVIKVIDTQLDERILLHGTTNHGSQARIDEYKLHPLSYYSYESPVNEAFRFLDKKRGKQKVAIVGLGVGVTACFQKEGRSFDFFEIDPDIADIAEDQDYFTFLSDCGSPYEIVLGDGRLTINKKPDEHYDLILLDAFSSDNIPVHLLTFEAIQLYKTKLKPDGVLVFNISNNYLDIEPVLAQTAMALDTQGYSRISLGKKLEDTKIESYPAHFFVIPSNNKQIEYFKKQGWTEANTRKGVGLWTDKYSNIISVLENVSGKKRMKIAVDERKEKEKQEEKDKEKEQ